jgi:hypothetical protein
VRYRWHPQFGSEIQIAYREHRRSEEVVVFASPDRSRTVLPAWMLDANACGAMTIGSPRVEISALLELRVLLTAMGFDRNASPVGEQERSDEGPTAAADSARVAAEPTASRRPYRSRAERAAGCWRSRETAEFWTGTINSTASRGVMPSGC